MIAAAPVITYNPTSGVGIGAAGNVAFYSGSPDTTRISSVVASLIGTSKKQVLVNAKINSWARDNRWHIQGDNRFYWTSQKTYGLGSDSPESDAVDQKYDAFRVYETVYRPVARDTYLGAGFLYNIHRDVRPADDAATEAWQDSPYITYSEQHGFDPASQTSAGLTVRTLFDTRDNPINPGRGWYANGGYLMFFDGFLGGTSSWQQLSYDVRRYVRISRNARHKLAFWLTGDFVTGGTAPYLDLPATGMDTYGRAGRGYPQGQVPRRGARLRRGGIPVDRHRERPVRDGGLPQHRDAQQQAGEQGPLRLLRHRRGLRVQADAEQTLEDEPLLRHRLRERRLTRRLLRRPGSVLTTGGQAPSMEALCSTGWGATWFRTPRSRSVARDWFATRS